MKPETLSQNSDSWFVQPPFSFLSPSPPLLSLLLPSPPLLSLPSFICILPSTSLPMVSTSICIPLPGETHFHSLLFFHLRPLLPSFHSLHDSSLLFLSLREKAQNLFLPF